MTRRVATDLTNNELLDRSLAIGIVSLPVVVVGFAWLVVAGFWNDWREERRRR
jgi:hypothetical protein